MVFLEISQNLQENTVPESIKKETLALVFSCEFCEISKNTFSYRTPLVAASDSTNVTDSTLSCSIRSSPGASQ